MRENRPRRLYRYFAVRYGDLIEVRRGFEKPTVLRSKLRIPKLPKSPRYTADGDLNNGTIMEQISVIGGTPIAYCHYNQFYAAFRKLISFYVEIPRAQRDKLLSISDKIEDE